MKVAMLCDYPLSSSEIKGGVSAASHNLVQCLLEHTDTKVVVAGFWPAYTKPGIQTIDQGRLKVIRCPPQSSFAHSCDFRKERRLFSRILAEEQPDVVHAQGEGIYASVAVESGLPNVYTIHGVRLKELDMERPELGFVRHFFRTRLIRKHHSKATNIIAINQYTRDAIAGLHEARVWMIRNAVADDFFSRCRIEDKQVGRLLQVGGVRARKDVPTLIKAVSVLRQRGLPVLLDLVGPVDDSIAEVRAMIDQLALQDNVRVWGLVDSDTLGQLYEQADIFVLSSIEESSPISIVQAMAAGLPVVSTDVGGIREMVRDGDNSFLVSPGDSQELAERLALLIADRELRQAFALQSRRLAEEDWSGRSVAQQTRALYDEIAGPPSRRTND